MYLVQIFLPLETNSGRTILDEQFQLVSNELTAKFRGITAYSRSPAEGLWKKDSDRSVRDDLIIYEIMCERLDREWWKSYRRDLERRFEQDSIVVRAQRIEMM